MPDANLEPKPGTAQYSLKGTQSLIGLFSMPAISEIPQSTELRMINGVGHGIWFYVDPTPEGEKLLWVSVHVPDPTSEAPCLLTLDPFPQGKAGEKILGLLQKAHRDGAKPEDVLPELEALGKQLNGVGWRPALDLPLKKRVELPPMTYISPPLEMVIKKDPSIGTSFVSTRNTNGKYDVCTSKIDPHDESISFAFYTSEDDGEPKLIKQVKVPVPPALRQSLEASGQPVVRTLRGLTEEFQTHFYKGGAESALARIERFNIKFNDAHSLPPDATKDARLRLMMSLRSPFEFQHTFASGAQLCVEAGDEVVGFMLKSSGQPSSSGYVASLDRARLKLSDSEWASRRSEFIAAARLLASESEAMQLKALGRISALATQQGGMPTEIKNILDEESTAIAQLLGYRHDLLIHTEVGYSPTEIRRLCDGSDVLVFSREVSRLGSGDLSIYNRIAFEFRPNGDLEFTAHNLSGNQFYGRLSAKGTNIVHGRPRAAMFLADLFAQQIRADGRYSFELAAHKLSSLDPNNSFLLTDGQSPYRDLPQANDAEGLRAFGLAEQCARKVCEHAGGYGKHHLAALERGVAEARLQFPAAPYDLVLRFQGKVITQANFIPKASPDGNESSSYTLIGAFDLAGSDVSELESLLIDFAKWGGDSSRKIVGTPPLEETLAFKALKRLLPTHVQVH